LHGVLGVGGADDQVGSDRQIERAFARDLAAGLVQGRLGDDRHAGQTAFFFNDVAEMVQIEVPNLIEQLL
jgi:hypothetical protein